MRMNRQEIQVLQNESERFIEDNISFKIVLAGDMPVLWMYIPERNMCKVPGEAQGS